MIIDRDKKCIISGFDPKECEAAHIIPYAICKTYERSNGILLIYVYINYLMIIFLV